MDDHHELSKVLSDPESMQYYPHPFNQEEVKIGSDGMRKIISNIITDYGQLF